MTQDREGGARRGAGYARLRATGIALEHADRALVAAVDAALVRLAHRAPVAGDRVLHAVSALAAGAGELARADLAALDDPFDRAFLVGRYHAWTGDAAGVGSELAHAVATIEHHATRPAVALVARDLLALAEALGDAAAGTRLRRAMRGIAPDSPADAWLLAEPGATRGGPGRDLLAALLAGETDAAAGAWQGRPDAAPAWTLPLLVSGLLGADPDAARGRLRLRLHAPETWSWWAVRRLHTGDAAVDVEVARSADRLVVRVDQATGMLPVTVLLEPVVHAAVTAAHIDEAPADLAPRRVRDHTVVPVQLVLDRPRTLAVQLEPGTRPQ